jgi:hypothetical protein
MPATEDLIARLDTWLKVNRPDYYTALQPGLTDPELDALRAEAALIFASQRVGSGNSGSESLFSRAQLRLSRPGIGWSLSRDDLLVRLDCLYGSFSCA